MSPDLLLLGVEDCCFFGEPCEAANSCLTTGTNSCPGGVAEMGLVADRLLAVLLGDTE